MSAGGRGGARPAFRLRGAGARRRRRSPRRRRGRLRGPARSAPEARARPEGRSREDLDPGARRAVSRLHRGGAPAAARDRRRLSRHGRLARLSEVAAAAAGRRGGGRAERRGACRRARAPPAASGGDARGGPPADGLARGSGFDVFPRGMPEPISVSTRVVWDASLYDLLSAYAALRLRGVVDARDRSASATCSRCRRRASG